MAKKKFYALIRYIDKLDGKTKVGYFRREGFDVPNNLGINLAVYRGTDPRDETVKTDWFVVDVDCGLSVGSGETKNKAISNALENLVKIDKEAYAKLKADVSKMYGEMPGHGVMYL